MTSDLSATLTETEWQDFRIEFPDAPKTSFKLAGLEVRKTGEDKSDETPFISARIRNTHSAETHYELIIDEAPITKEISLLSLPDELKEHAKGVFPKIVDQDNVLQLKANRENELAVHVKLERVVQIVRQETLN